MAIHVIKRDGEFVYRFWGSSGGGYYTPEMNEAQLTQWLLEYELERKITSFGMSMRRSFEGARRIGTSSLVSQDRSLTEWDDNTQGEDDCCTDDPEQYIGESVYIIDENPIKRIPYLVDGKKLKVTIKVELVDE